MSLAPLIEHLKQGGLLGLPTETVYGLAADASNKAAVARIFAAKGRPADHPLIVHCADTQSATTWALDWTAPMQALAEAFWPGPLTLIVPKAAHVLNEVTGGQDSVGLRVPAHPLALAVLQAFQGGLAAPSANRYGHVSPTHASHVGSEFPELIASGALLVLDGGECEVGIESTIIDCTELPFRLLRPGMLSTREIALAIGYEPLLANQNKPRASGDKDSHYAPNTPAFLVDAPVANLNEVVLQLSNEPKQAAHDLYAQLRAADALQATRILIQRPPQTPEWAAVNDRLQRACHR
jgi:L-threonylcarbamoyladenylate synthase